MVNWSEVVTQMQTFKLNFKILNISIGIAVNKFEKDLKNKTTQKNKTKYKILNHAEMVANDPLLY